MAGPSYLAEQLNFGLGLVPNLSTSAAVGGFIQMPFLEELLIICNYNNAGEVAETFRLQETTPTTSSVQTLQTSVPIWTNTEPHGNTELTRQDDGVEYATDADDDYGMVIFRVTPNDLSDGFTRIRVYATAAAASYRSVMYLAKPCQCPPNSPGLIG